MEPPSNPGLAPLSPYKRFLQAIGLDKPDTAEDLEQEIQELGATVEVNGLVFQVVSATKRRVITVKIHQQDE